MEVELSIEGMTDQASVSIVKEALKAIEGVISVKIELEEGRLRYMLKKA